MLDLPMLAHLSPSSVVAWEAGRPIECRQFLADISKLMAHVPRRSYVFNLCKNRYRFAVAFTAALARRQINLLPPSEAPQVLRDISRRYSDVYCLTDQSECPTDLEVCRYPQDSDSVGEPLSSPMFAGDQVAAIVFTSGSTGEPSANVKTWAQLMAETSMAMQRFWGARDRPASVVGTVAPQHMYGLETTFLLPLRSGFGFHAGRPLFPEDIRTALEAVPAPRMLVTTPLHIRACVTERTRFPEVAFILSATAPLSPGLAQQAERIFQTEVLEIYGCSETGSIATRRTVEGNLWRAYDEMSLFRKGERCFVRGPSVSEPVELNDVIQLRNSHEFSLHGRLADLINIAGKRSSLADLNHKLNQIEGVQDGVFFMPDEVSDRMSRLIAFVVAPELSKDDVVRALRQTIDAVFMPRPLYIVDALPRTQNGKLPRARLSEFAATLAAGRKEAESI